MTTLLLASAATVVAPAHAWQLGLNLGNAHYRAEERRSDGQLFNSESGQLELRSASLKTSLWGADLKVAISSGSGTLDYVGQTQLFIPLYTQTRLHQNLLQARLDLPMAALGPGLEIRLLTGIGSFKQRRAIQATGLTSALTETLRSVEVDWGVGLAVQQNWASGRWDWGLQVRGSQPLRQRLQVDAGTVFDALELQPSRRAGSELWLGIGWQISPRLSLQVQATARQWRPGPAAQLIARRGIVPIGQVGYPGSHQQQQDCHAGLLFDI